MGTDLGVSRWVSPVDTGSAARQAFVLLCVFGAGWAIVEDVFGRGLEQPYNLLQIVWMRYAVHLLIVAAVFGWRKPAAIWQTRRPVFHIVRSLLMLLMPLSFVLALMRGSSPAFTWAVFWVAPAMIMFIAAVAQNARPPLWTWMAAGAGWVGAALVFDLPMPKSLLEFGPPLLMAFSFAAYVAMTRSLRHEAVAANMFYTAIGVFAVLTAYVPGVWIWPGWHDLAMFAGIGGVGFVSLLALDRAAARSSVADTAPAFYFQVPCIVAVGLAQAHYPAGWATLAGCGLIAAGLLVAWRPLADR